MVRTIVRHSRAYTSTSRVLAHLLAASSWNLKAAFVKAIYCAIQYFPSCGDLL